MAAVIAALFTLAATVAGPPAGPHALEVAVFANTMAIARTAQESCPGLVFDGTFLEALRQDLHVILADQPAFASQAREAAEKLKQWVAARPSREAWCAQALDLYGPEGKNLPGVLRRRR